MKKKPIGYKRTLLFLLSLLLFVQAGLFPLSEPVFAAEAEQTEELLSEPEELLLEEEAPTGAQPEPAEPVTEMPSQDPPAESEPESPQQPESPEPATEIAEQEQPAAPETETEGLLEEETEPESREQGNGDGLIEDPEAPQIIPGEEPEETVVLQDATAVPDSAPAGITTFSLASYDGAFGNQLDSVSRKFYDERVSYYVTGRASGSMTVEYTAETSPVTFEASVVEQENGTLVIDRTAQEYLDFQDQVRFSMQSSVDAFLYDHPEIFWFRGGSYSYAPGKKYDESTGEWTGYLAKLVYTPGVAFSGAKSLMGAYDAALPQVAARIAQEADDNGDGRCDDVELVRGIHDYLCQTLYYDTAAYESYQQTGDYRIFCSAGAILPGTVGSGVVCEGYAKGFKVLCDQLGIPCVLIGGTVVQNNVREGHMWNGVQIGGRWYLVDATWDDKVDTISYQYFLAGDTFGNRVSSGNFGGSDPGGSTIFTYPYLETQGISYCDTVAHIYEAVETAAPACTTEGYTLYQCSACGASYKETVPALSHDYQVQSTVAATCTADGYTVYACSRCGDTYTGDAVSALGHDYRVQSTAAAACTAGGYTVYACSRCADTYTGDTVPALGHHYVQTADSATCTSAGKLTYTCSRCKASYQTARAAYGHTYVQGLCSRCGIGDTITKASVSSIAKQGYTGKAIKPSVKVSFGGRTLRQGTDYTLAYRNNKKVGTAQVTITGKGKYRGTRTLSFKIVKQSVASLKYSRISDKTYNGKAQKPNVTVKNGSLKLKKNKDYTITYSKNKNIGKAVITIKGKGSYNGKKKLYFNIVPKKTALTRVVSNTKSRMGVNWKKISGVTGYQIQYSTSSSFKNAKTVTVKGKTSRVIKNLKKGKTYYVRVRTYKTVDKVKYYSGWCGKKKVKIRKK